MSGGILVLQSYRADDVPEWIATCMESVRCWAEANGFGYRRIGDALFDPLPADLPALGAPPALPATDLARLLWIRKLFGEGWGRILWLDADILVLAPKAFAIDSAPDHIFCRELWTWHDEDRLKGRWSINNCAMAFAAGSDFLERYIGTCIDLARTSSGRLSRLALGPDLLTRWDKSEPLPQIVTVPTLSPLLIGAALHGDRKPIDAFLDVWNAPIHAVHLCRSLGEKEGEPIGGKDQAEIVARLASDPGAILGRAASPRE